MPAYSFKPQFVEPIRAGTKGGTIRAERRHPNISRPGGHARVGEMLSLYFRQRHPTGFLIRKPTCIATEPIHLNFRWDRVETRDDTHSLVVMMRGQLDPFARFDGFECWDEMRRFWTAPEHTEVFRGWHIRWLPLPFFEARSPSAHDEAAHG